VSRVTLHIVYLFSRATHVVSCLSQVTEGAGAYKDGRLQVGQRILEVI
jgi:hypothetical protein